MTGRITATFDIKSGDKLNIIWDGVSYNVTVKKPEGAPSGVLAFGNFGLMGVGDTEDYPFMGALEGDNLDWFTADTAASHTIYITTQGTVYQTIDEKFLPKDVIIKIVGTNIILENTYLLFDKTDEEINNALNNGSTVKLDYYGDNLQYDLNKKVFWGVILDNYGSNGIEKLAVVYVKKLADGWYCKETYITTTTT